MLHHTLPATLSQLIIAGRDDLIQKVLNSTYGIFGIIVTDPSDQSILYCTDKVYHRRSWQQKAIPEELGNLNQYEHYDLLTDPPPLEPAWEYRGPGDTGLPHSTGIQRSLVRNVLGHVYYIRPDPPGFVEDMCSLWGPGFPDLSGAKRGYLYLAMCCIAASFTLALMFSVRQNAIAKRKQELGFIHRELDIRKKVLDQMYQELTAQKNWFEEEAEQSQRRALALKHWLAKLRETMNMIDAANLASGHLDNPVRVPQSCNSSGTVLEEMERLILALTDNAGALKSQANLLHDYCAILEQRQMEMQSTVETAHRQGRETESNYHLPEKYLDVSVN